jgi:hypothetical protein
VQSERDPDRRACRAQRSAAAALPLQILFLNLVTDVFPAFALGTIEADKDVLARPPRPPSEPILARRQWTAIVAHGISIAGITLAALLIATYGYELDGAVVTTICFHTLALAQLWHVFNMRNWRDSLLRSNVTRNAFVWSAIALCLVILAAANLIPVVADALKLVPLESETWMVVLGLSFVPVLFRQIAALVRRPPSSSTVSFSNSVKLRKSVLTSREFGLIAFGSADSTRFSRFLNDTGNSVPCSIAVATASIKRVWYCMFAAVDRREEVARSGSSPIRLKKSSTNEILCFSVGRQPTENRTSIELTRRSISSYAAPQCKI